MANNYNLLEWVNGYEKDNSEFDCKTDALDSKNKKLAPGRFYILNYKAQTDKPYNSRPVIISLGISKKDPESFLCIDLCLIPRTMRIQFVQKIFDIFENQILDNMKKHWDVADADNQTSIISCNYDMFDKNRLLHPFKNAVKRYKIENTFKIYSLPFSGVYKVVGRYADKNYFVNTNVVIEQKNFLDKAKKKQ